MGYRGCESGKCSNNQCKGMEVCMQHISSISIIRQEEEEEEQFIDVGVQAGYYNRQFLAAVMNEVYLFGCLFVMISHSNGSSITNLALKSTIYPQRNEISKYSFSFLLFLLSVKMITLTRNRTNISLSSFSSYQTTIHANNTITMT